MFALDEDSDESNELYSSENENEYSDKSNSDLEYTTKKGCIRKKMKFDEKTNNSKIIKRKSKKKEDISRDFQSNDIKRVVSLRSINTTISNQLESKGMFNHLVII